MLPLHVLEVARQHYGWPAFASSSHLACVCECMHLWCKCIQPWCNMLQGCGSILECMSLPGVLLLHPMSDLKTHCPFSWRTDSPHLPMRGVGCEAYAGLTIRQQGSGPCSASISHSNPLLVGVQLGWGGGPLRRRQERCHCKAAPQMVLLTGMRVTWMCR